MSSRRNSAREKSSSSNSSSTDFLTKPPSVQGDESESSTDFLTKPPTPRSSSSSGQQPTPPPNRQRRKQAQPKRRDRVIKEIIRLVNSTDPCIPRLSFQRLVREIVQTHGDFRMQSQSLAAMQESAEMFIVHLFEDANLVASNAKRVTVMLNDVRLINLFRSPDHEV